MEEVAMKALATIFFAAVLPATSASAQFTITGPQQTSAFGVDPIIRVTKSFRTTLVTVRSEEAIWRMTKATLIGLGLYSAQPVK
jgi:hypothetical protein